MRRRRPKPSSLRWQQHGIPTDVMHVLLLNLLFFVPATCGAGAFVFCVYRCLRFMPPPAAPPPGGGSKAPLPAAGPDDLARSA